MRLLHGVALTDSALTGVPFLQPLDCDSCRVVVLRSTIDSVRNGDQVGGAFASVALGVVAVLGFFFISCQVGGSQCGIFESIVN